MASATPTRELVRLAFGPNPHKYLATYDKLAAKSLRGWVAGWCWPAFFVTFPWLLYRKQWLAAILSFLAPLLLAFFVRPEISSLVISLVYALVGKSIVVKKAVRDARRATAAETDPQYIREQISREGGVSVPGAIIGATIEIVLILIGFVIGFAIAAHRITTPAGRAPVAVENYVVQSAPPIDL